VFNNRTLEEQALAFLYKLAEGGGAIVSSNNCSEMEIANAQACGRFFVDPDGLGYVLRSKRWLDTREEAYHQYLTHGGGPY
jgi:hypothetical protein